MGRYQKKDRQISAQKIDNAMQKNKERILVKKNLYEDELDEKQFNAEIYGQRVKNLRFQLGLTIEEFANSIGTSKATLSKIESGKNKTLNVDFMWLICAIADTSPDYLFGLTDNSSKSKFIDKDGQERIACEVVHFMEVDHAVLTSEIEKAYITDPELCSTILHILRSSDTRLKERALQALRLACAVRRDTP